MRCLSGYPRLRYGWTTHLACKFENRMSKRAASPSANIPQNSSRNVSASFSPWWSWEAKEDGGLATWKFWSSNDCFFKMLFWCFLFASTSNDTHLCSAECNKMGRSTNLAGVTWLGCALVQMLRIRPQANILCDADDLTTYAPTVCWKLVVYLLWSCFFPSWHGVTFDCSLHR